MAGEACEDCNGRGWIDLPGGHYETPCKRCNGRVAEIVEENNRFEAEIATLRARVAELEAALRTARQNVLADALAAVKAASCGGCNARGDWDECFSALNTSVGPVNVSAGGEHER